MKRQQIEAVLPYALVGAFALAMLLFFPFRFKFEFDSDEGIQLIKAFLYANGHALQTEIFSDQPPLLTVLLAGLFKILGPKVLVARLVILAFSCLLLTSCVLCLKLFHGTVSFLAAFLFVTTLPFFPQLSVSVMIGLPAISLAMASLLVLGAWYRTGKTGWLLLSAVLMALSFLAKAFTLILVPVVALSILIWPPTGDPSGRPAMRAWAHALTWTATLGGVVLALLWAFIEPSTWYQLIAVHADAREATFVGGARAITYLWATWPLLALAMVGGWLSLARRSWSGTCLAGWFVLGLLAVLVNQPAWWHQHLLATVPAAMLAGITIAECISNLRSRKGLSFPLGWRRTLCLLGLLLAAGYLAVRIPGHLQGFKLKLPNVFDDVELSAREYNVLAAMGKYDPDDGVIVTDSPMFAFRSGREVPPELAVFSNKRLRTGWLTEDQIIAAVRDRQPRLVLFARFSLPRVQAYVQDRYWLVYAYSPFRLYLRE